MLSSSQRLSTHGFKKKRKTEYQIRDYLMKYFLTKKCNISNILIYLKLECHDSSTSSMFEKIFSNFWLLWQKSCF